MTNSKLMTTVAALALTAGSAWAQETENSTVKVQTETAVEAETELTDTDAEVATEMETETETTTTEMTEMEAESDLEEGVTVFSNADSEPGLEPAEAASEVAETDPSRTEPEAESAESLTEQTSIIEESDEEGAVAITEENVREATENDVNVADGGETDFSDQEPILSGDVDDDGTAAIDDAKPTADVTAGADPEADGVTVDPPEVALNESADEIPARGLIDEEFGGLTAGDLIGRRVYGADGERVGDVDEVVDVNGQLAVIVNIGGFLWFGGREVAVALNELREGGTDEVRLIELTGAEVENRPSIDDDRFIEVNEDVRLDERM